MHVRMFYDYLVPHVALRRRQQQRVHKRRHNTFRLDSDVYHHHPRAPKAVARRRAFQPFSSLCE